MKFFEYIKLLPECKRCKNKNVCNHKPYLHADKFCNYVIEHDSDESENSMNELNMKWIVYRYNINTEKIEAYNIFDHGSFNMEVELLLKSRCSKEKFSNKLKNILLYYFWSKAEWEILISPFISKDNAIEKIDVYQQVIANWEQFADYCWRFK